MRRIVIPEGQITDCFPRVSGDEPAFQSMKDSVAKFSPRERG